MSLNVAGRRRWFSVSNAQVLELTTCIAGTYRCLNHSQSWWRQIKVFICTIQNR